MQIFLFYLIAQFLLLVYNEESVKRYFDTMALRPQS